jgi:hypothetical protein
MWYCWVNQHGGMKADDATRPKELEGRENVFDLHSAVRPLAASPNSGGHKSGHNSQPTQADAGHRERDARRKSPAQARCSRFQPQAPMPLKSPPVPSRVHPADAADSSTIAGLRPWRPR